MRLLELATAAFLLVLAADAWAPPQDLPWTPLRLSDPPGMATGMKFQRAARDPASCRAILRQGGVRFAEVEPRTQGFCTTLDSVRLRGGATPLSPAAPVMTCRLALAYAFWERHEVRPAARRHLDAPIARIEHYGTFACRNIYGRAEAPPSQHASANALDVAAFRTGRGEAITVLRDFDRRDERGAFLHEVRDGACRWFGAVLSPDYNEAHRDHLHLDFGAFGACR